MPFDIKELLKEKKPLIDKTIEKWIPRKYDEESLEFTLGPAHYRYNTETSNKAVSEVIWEFLDRGGKRWRPFLLLLVCEALGGDPEKFMDFVVIPEVIHNGTIMIDDIEDDSDLRRGKPCSHKIFGTDIVINAGNTMYFLPFLILNKNKNLDEKTKNKAYEIMTQEMVNLSFGQAMDISWHNGMANADNISEEEYLQMCAYKTGTLARMSAKIGSVLAGADDKIIEKMGELAESIGVAFQIQDDILNITGEKFAKGKGLGEDIHEGKRTLMVIHTLRNADETDKKRLIEILNKHPEDKKEIKEGIEILKKYGSIPYAKNKAREMVKEAWKKAEKIIPESGAKEKLKAFADYLIERDI